MIRPSWESPNNENAPNIDIEYFAVFGSGTLKQNQSTLKIHLVSKTDQI
jgi:hypothetical protein